MKKITVTILATTLTISSLLVVQNVFATDFSGQEDKYMNICASDTLSKSDENVCKEFNAYLKEKNKNLKSQMSDNEKEIANSKASIDELDATLKDLNSSISSKEAEITYLNNSISTLEKNIANKETELKDRMYSMQSYINSNYYIDFIFGASNFSDLFSRMNSITELTAYDKTLIQELANSKKEIEQQKSTVNTALANLASQKSQQETLQTTYLAKYQELNSDLIAKQKEVIDNTNTTEKIDDNMAALALAAEQSRVEGITQIPTPPVNNNTQNNNSSNGNSSNNDTSNNNSNNNDSSSDNDNSSSETTPTPPVEESGDSSVGIAIANYALSKQGSPYVWGASGPNSFDCSGLVYWAHRQAGIKFSRPTAASLSGMGVAVSYSNLQPGDIITFKTSPSYVSHVGIYIGGGKMVHAPVPGQTVQVANLNIAYWQNALYNCRRLY